MWRLLVQRLGVGYLLLLPALFVLGGATDAGIQAFCYHINSPLEAVSGRGLLHQEDLVSVMIWTWKNPGCVVIAFMLPWWVGAWALVRSKSVPTLLFFSQVVLGVVSSVVAQIALFLWCAAELARAMQLWSFASKGCAHWVFFAALLIAVTLVIAGASKLKDDK